MPTRQKEQIFLNELQEIYNNIYYKLAEQCNNLRNGKSISEDFPTLELELNSIKKNLDNLAYEIKNDIGEIPDNLKQYLDSSQAMLRDIQKTAELNLQQLQKSLD